MADVQHPVLTPTADDPSPMFYGPFRQLLHDSRLLPALTSLSTSPSPGGGDAALAAATHAVTSAALTSLLSVQVGAVLGVWGVVPRASSQC